MMSKPATTSRVEVLRAHDELRGRSFLAPARRRSPDAGPTTHSSIRTATACTTSLTSPKISERQPLEHRPGLPRSPLMTPCCHADASNRERPSAAPLPDHPLSLCRRGPVDGVEPIRISSSPTSASSTILPYRSTAADPWSGGTLTTSGRALEPRFFLVIGGGLGAIVLLPLVGLLRMNPPQ